jgi:hypothetical protein
MTVDMNLSYAAAKISVGNGANFILDALWLLNGSKPKDIALSIYTRFKRKNWNLKIEMTVDSPSTTW